MIAIIGAGNVLMKDEGIGVRIVEDLKSRGLPEGIDVFDAGTSLMELMPYFQSYRRLILVDAVRGGNRPGTVYRFQPEDVKEIAGPFGQALGLHQISLLESLAMNSLVTGKQHDVTIIGIEPKEIDLGLELSSELGEKVSDIADLVLEEALKNTAS